MDTNNLTPNNIDQWASRASPEQVIETASRLLSKVASYSDTHRQSFAQGLNQDVRSKLFEGQPVG